MSKSKKIFGFGLLNRNQNNLNKKGGSNEPPFNYIIRGTKNYTQPKTEY